jgi:hypothetical protein
MLLDEFLPVYDVSDAVARVVDADVTTTWDALMSVDLIDVGRQKPMVGMLGALRILPDVMSHVIHGERPAAARQQLRLRDMAEIPLGEGGWVVLGERAAEEIAFGLIGKFWRPVIEFAAVRSADEFRRFSTPGFAKTIYSLSVTRIDDHHTLLAGAMRTATTDEHAQRWFRRYWTLGIGSGAHVLVNGLLEVTRDMAEERVSERSFS